MQKEERESIQNVKNHNTQWYWNFKFILSVQLFSVNHLKGLLNNSRTSTATYEYNTFPESFNFVQKYCAEFLWLVQSY